jgi:hypothetical protein
MIDSTRTTGQKQPEELQIDAALREWVKPTLERLSLKQALTGSGCNHEGCTFGS